MRKVLFSISVLLLLQWTLFLFCFLIGIVCMDRLDDIVKLVGSNAIGRKEGQLVVQKYIGNRWMSIFK